MACSERLLVCCCPEVWYIDLCDVALVVVAPMLGVAGGDFVMPKTVKIQPFLVQNVRLLFWIFDNITERGRV